MRAMVIFGIVLFIAGLAVLVWPAFTYTTTEEVLDIGPVEVTTEDRERVELPPLLGLGAAAAGITMIVLGSRTQNCLRRMRRRQPGGTASRSLRLQPRSMGRSSTVSEPTVEQNHWGLAQLTPRVQVRRRCLLLSIWRYQLAR